MKFNLSFSFIKQDYFCLKLKYFNKNLQKVKLQRIFVSEYSQTNKKQNINYHENNKTPRTANKGYSSQN